MCSTPPFEWSEYSNDCEQREPCPSLTCKDKWLAYRKLIEKCTNKVKPINSDCVADETESEGDDAPEVDDVSIYAGCCQGVAADNVEATSMIADYSEMMGMPLPEEEINGPNDCASNADPELLADHIPLASASNEHLCLVGGISDVLIAEESSADCGYTTVPLAASHCDSNIEVSMTDINDNVVITIDSQYQPGFDTAPLAPSHWDSNIGVCMTKEVCLNKQDPQAMIAENFSAMVDMPLSEGIFTVGTDVSDYDQDKHAIIADKTSNLVKVSTPKTERKINRFDEFFDIA